MKDPRQTFAPSMLGFGAVPGTAEESREYVQRRLRIYVGLIASMWSLLFVAQVATLALAASDRLRAFMQSGTAWLWLAACLLLGGLWQYLKTPLTLKMVDLVDATTVMTQAIVLAFMLYTAFEPRVRPDLAILLGLTHVLVSRAALVPSTAARTGLLGGASVIVVAAATLFLYTNRPLPDGFPPPAALAALAAIWGALAVLVSVAITQIIYGLERKVRQASSLGQYTLEAPIGEGGMGTVYLARHALLRRPTAVKLLPPERAGQDAIRRFEREVQLTSQLTHPNVVAVYDYGRTPEGVFYYAMEYLDGVDLQQLVDASGPMEPARVRHVLRQVADALAEAHAIGLIHRDIKPANIIVQSRGRQHDFVKVLDFGLVKESRPDKGGVSLSSVTMLLGTPLYVSPEAISDPRKIDGRSDLYSLGCVAYFLLAGAPFVKGKTLVEVCAAHLYEKPVPPSKRLGRELPASLEALVMRMLEKAPDKRPQSAVEVVEALDTMADVGAWGPIDAENEWARLSESDAPPLSKRPAALESLDKSMSRKLAVDLDRR
jgi:serine/threonine-protein kinase